MRSAYAGYSVCYSETPISKKKKQKRKNKMGKESRRRKRKMTRRKDWLKRWR